MKELNDFTIDDLLIKPGFWSKTGPFSDVVLSTSIRLNRNIYNVSFPFRQDDSDINYIKAIAEKFANESEFSNKLRFLDFKNIDDLTKKFLKERNIISNELVANDYNSIIFGIDKNFDIIVNDEDHFKLQVIKPGLQIMEAYDIANSLDDELNKFVIYAYSQNIGYITSCPSNLGTGLKVSTMLHLPVLSMNKKITEVIKLADNSGHKVVGTRGEGIKTLGAIYQISNRASLGVSEKDLMKEGESITHKIIEMECNARDEYLSDYQNQLEDKICRSYGIIKYARSLDYAEAMSYLSDIRLGIILSFIKGIELYKIHDLMINSQWSYLQKIANRIFIDPSECDNYRANYLRDQLEWSTVYG